MENEHFIQHQMIFVSHLPTATQGEPIIHSGTIPCERLWANIMDFFPISGRTMKREWFNLLNALAYLRYNWRHFNNHRTPTWCEGDALLAESLEDMIELTQLLRADPLGESPESLQSLREVFAAQSNQNQKD